MSNGETMTKMGRLRAQVQSMRAELKEGARIGTASLLTVSGGVIAGWFQAKYPTLGSTTLPTAGALGSALVLGALSGAFEDYSDQINALGSGMLASVLSHESEKYFKS